jgi:hypothetical protein
LERKSKYQKFAEKVARAEQIPTDRDATADEIAQLVGLLKKLEVSAIGAPRYKNLYDRARLVQGRLGISEAIADVAAPTDPAETPQPPPKKRPGRGFGPIYNELTHFAALRRSLAPEELARLDVIVKETRALAAEDPVFRRLYQQAKLVRKGQISRSKSVARQRSGGRGGVGPAGMVASPGLSLARREVLGGAPSSRRGH